MPFPRLFIGAGLDVTGPTTERNKFAVGSELTAVTCTVKILRTFLPVSTTDVMVITSTAPEDVLVEDGADWTTLEVADGGAQTTVGGGVLPGHGLSWPMMTVSLGGAIPRVPGM
jgi:hypothetical protein